MDGWLAELAGNSHLSVAKAGVWAELGKSFAKQNQKAKKLEKNKAHQSRYNVINA